MAEQQEVQQRITPCGSGGNVVNTLQPVIIMVPTSAQVKQKRSYDKIFPKKIILTLSVIQIWMAAIGIITGIKIVSLSERYHGAHIVGAGIWCGVFFGFSGFFGIIAGLKPSFPTVLTFMVFSIISACFCLPLLVISSVGTADSPRRCYRYYSNSTCVSHAMFAIQITISLIQAIAAIASSSMACRAVCDCCACCRPTEDTGVVYYSNTGGNGLSNMTTQQVGYPQSQPGYVTIPISQLQGAASGATALPTLTGAETGDKPQAKAETPPPEYKSVAVLENKDEEENGSKYQRFQ